MQDGSDYFEGQCPSAPQAAKQAHDNDRLYHSASDFGEESSAENLDQEGVILVIDSVQNHGKMGPKFSDDVKGTWKGRGMEVSDLVIIISEQSLATGHDFPLEQLTPDKTQSELDCSVPLMLKIQTDGHSGLSDDNGADMMQGADRRDGCAVE